MASKSTVVSGAGLVASFATNLMNAVHRKGGTDEDIHPLADPEKSRNIWDQIADVVIGASIFRCIRFGPDLKTADDFFRAFDARGVKVGDWARDMMSKPAFAKSLENARPDEEFDLVVRTTVELVGENRNATTAEVFAGAKRLGLEKCPAWVGPKLRLDYQDQPNGEVFLLYMEPITDSDGGLGVFSVERDDYGLWLHSYYDYSDSLWVASDRWVLVRPRK